ncbi:MAG TPA: hypothetical protein VGJ26_18410 [Pirellulales bacterium]|jgi:uncharacterized membrane protein
MSRNFLRFAAIVFASICAAKTATSAAPAITTVGNFPGWDQTYGIALSGNGTTVVGVAEDTVNLVGRAARWTAGTGVQDIGPGDASLSSSANGVSADGSVVVGSFGNSTAEAFRWTAASGVVAMGFLPGGNFSIASEVNGNGSVIVGQANDATTLRAFAWSAATGMQALPIAPGFDFTYGAASVSADGTVIVGTNANQGGVSSADRAYRYTSAGGYQDLGVQPGFFRSAASNVSGDGLTVVGLSQSFPGFSTVIGAFRWTQSTGLVPLFFDDEVSSYANAVNYDGSRIVGVSIGATGSRAVMWTSTLGSVDLNTYLPTLGVNLSGWNLTGASGISYDGSVISGDGTFNGVETSWIVSTSSVPEPSALLLTALGSAALVGTPRRKWARYLQG